MVAGMPVTTAFTCFFPDHDATVGRTVITDPIRIDNQPSGQMGHRNPYPTTFGAIEMPYRPPSRLWILNQWNRIL